MQKFILALLETIIFEKLLNKLLDKENRKKLGEHIKSLDKNSIQYSIYKFFKYIIIFIISWIILIIMLIGIIIYLLIKQIANKPKR